LAPARAQAEMAWMRLDEVATAVAGFADEDGGERQASLARAADELREAARGLRLAFQGTGGDAVAAFERVIPPYDRWRLAVRPVSPADPFHARFLSALESFCAVSASLFVAGDAFPALGLLELEERAPAPPRRLSVPSPFPYAEHMRAIALAPEGDLVEETAATLADLARALGGRTLGLFTSLWRMNQVADLLTERLRGDGIEVLAPRGAGDDPNALVERFRRGGEAVLLGARTFWQGLDIPGPDLQALVIEKLPFEVPTELRRRRELRWKQAGIDAFERETLGRMLLYLKQMVGRLIRSEDDRGVVVVVEGRSDKRYFRRLGDALPPGVQFRVARRRELPDVLREIGIGGA
jgi:ATP-dependent DNA helicase DinG